MLVTTVTTTRVATGATKLATGKMGERRIEVPLDCSYRLVLGSTLHVVLQVFGVCLGLCSLKDHAMQAEHRAGESVLEETAAVVEP